ncbi:DNA polymerase III subunit delta [Sphingomonas sp. GC_Shp_3]|uniref:DNA polymerase III subunit delta n=1 Tax=Sphingomonas sp. GC_Shp_3 TaxID=2937383 RepID=UPI00226A86EA
MKANANQIRTAIDAVSPDVRLYLFHGPDESGARELAARLGRALGPEAERIDLEPAQLRSNPGLLADEAAALSLFGGARHIRVAGAGEESLEALTLLLDADRSGNPVVVLAPTLKATAKVVKLALAHQCAMCLACYLPEGGDADRLATAIAREHGLRTTGGTAARLAAASGGDRAVMTRELEKLALYLDAAPERPRELDDAALDAVGANLGDSEMSRAIEAALDGYPDTLADELAGLAEAGVSPIPVLRQLARRLIALAEMQADIDAGADPKALIERVFFRERASTTRALRLWDTARISDAIERIRQAERAIMLPNNPGNVVADAAMTVIARMAARQR